MRYKNKKSIKRSRKLFSRQTLIYSIAALGTLIVIVVLLNAFNIVSFPWSKSNNLNLVPSAGYTGQNYTNSTTNNNKSSKSSAAGSSTGEPTQSNTSVKTPYGTFVSNHYPGKNGAPLNIDSVCITTPGASCTIKFTRSGISKSLSSQKVNSDGYAYWNQWKPSDIGLTSGSWKIEAIATLNGKTASAQDSIALEVQ